MSVLRRNIAALMGAAALAACSSGDQQSPASTSAVNGQVSANLRSSLSGSTTQPAQAEVLLPQARLVPIISSGDLMPGSNLPWAPTPDGLGAFREGRSVVVFANHEITAAGVTSSNGGSAFLYSRVSRLTIDPATLKVTDGIYAENGISQYIRLCSATWVDAAEGLPSGYFLAGEENGATPNGSTAIAVSRDGSKVTKLPHLGALSHENVIAVPGFGRKIVAFGTDDAAGQSELYMYVAADEAGFINGTGKLYVFKTDATTAGGAPLHSGNLVDGQTVPGYFVEIADPGDLAAAPASRFNNLQSKVDKLGAMPFVRLEDIDYLKQDGDDDDRSFGREGDRDDDRRGRRPAVYFLDTGSESVKGRAAVGAACGGPCDPAGSLYRVTLDPRDPTTNAQLTLIQRSKGAAYGWASPDNISLSRNSVMVMEDPAYSGFDGSRAPGIFNARLSSRGDVGTFTQVVKLTQETLIPGPAGKCVDAAGLCWESSGIITTEELLGEGTWLFDVQAHTLPFTAGTGTDAKVYPKEGGQLLYLRLPGS
jgi:hypothetical protein